jgi:pimeloyl-ACP methyl ester carboxylesterase
MPFDMAVSAVTIIERRWVLVSDGGFTTTADGVRLFVHISGRGSQSLVVPGVGADLDFRGLAEGRRVAFYDVRNRGRSDPVDGSGRVGLPVEIDDVETVRAHSGFARTSVLGWSYVGLVVALYAAQHPRTVDRLVMVCPAPPSPSLQPVSGAADTVLLARLNELEARRATADPVEFARAWRRIVTPTRMADPAALDLLQADPSRWPNEWPEHMTEALWRVHATHPVDFDYRHRAEQISAPTLVIHGGADIIPLPASEAWSRAIPDARLLVLPDVGHFPHVEAPSEFFGAVETFLGGHWPTNARSFSG